MLLGLGQRGISLLLGAAEDLVAVADRLLEEQPRTLLAIRHQRGRLGDGTGACALRLAAHPDGVLLCARALLLRQSGHRPDMLVGVRSCAVDLHLGVRGQVCEPLLVVGELALDPSAGVGAELIRRRPGLGDEPISLVAGGLDGSGRCPFRGGHDDGDLLARVAQRLLGVLPRGGELAGRGCAVVLGGAARGVGGLVCLALLLRLRRQPRRVRGSLLGSLGSQPVSVLLRGLQDLDGVTVHVTDIPMPPGCHRHEGRL